MSLLQVLSEAFSGGRQVPAGQSFGGYLDEMRRLAGGSRRKVSRLTGIPETTLRRWDKSGVPRTSKYADAARARIERGMRHLYRVPDANVTKLKVQIAGPSKGPMWRNVEVRADAVKRAGDAWEAGDLAGMYREFRAGIVDPWYREHLFRPQAGDPGYRARKAGAGGPGGRTPGTAGGGGGGAGGGSYDDDGDDDYGDDDYGEGFDQDTDDVIDDDADYDALDLAYEGAAADGEADSEPSAVGVSW